MGALQSAERDLAATDYEDFDDEALLLEAQREAAEAEAMLKEAEEEAAKWEKELADLEAAAADDALANMASAYEAALDAANDNVDLLSSQILALESELSSTITRMETSVEDKERISAEYAYLAKNFGELKDSQGKSGVLLEEEIGGYQSQITTLEGRLDGMESSLKEAQDEAAKWKADYAKVQSELQEAVS